MKKQKRNTILTITSLALITILIGLMGCAPEMETEYPIRDSSNNFVTLSTDFGDMTLELYRDVAPAHADSFLARTNEGFYSGLKFFRIIKGFMLQGGDPQNMGIGGPGYTIDAEFSDLKHTEGTLSMARSRSENSAGSQFFVCFTARPSLDGQYTVFGHVVNGLATLKAIEQVEVEKSPSGEMAKPVEDVVIKEAYQSDAEGKRID